MTRIKIYRRWRMKRRRQTGRLLVVRALEELAVEPPNPAPTHVHPPVESIRT